MSAFKEENQMLSWRESAFRQSGEGEDDEDDDDDEEEEGDAASSSARPALTASIGNFTESGEC